MNTRVSAGGGARAAVVAILVACYPFLVALGLDRTSARTLGAVLLAATVAGIVASGGGTSRLLQLALKRFGFLAAVALVATATNHPVALTLLPSFTNLWLLATFGATLRKGPSIVEQFACASHDEFPDFLLPYCRRVTVMWCVFFALNAATSAVLAVAATAHAWAFYTGFLSYVLIGVLGIGEYLFHKSRFRFYEDGWVDGVWRRFFPPAGTALGRRTLEWQQKARRGRAAMTRVLRYFGGLTNGRIVLWSYLIWYLVNVTTHFDPRPRLWLTSMGLSAIIGTALWISTRSSSVGTTELDRWQILRLFMMPFCVSSFSALVKDGGYTLVFPPSLALNATGFGLVAMFVTLVLALRRSSAPR